MPVFRDRGLETLVALVGPEEGPEEELEQPEALRLLARRPNRHRRQGRTRQVDSRLGPHPTGDPYPGSGRRDTAAALAEEAKGEEEEEEEALHH